MVGLDEFWPEETDVFCQFTFNTKHFNYVYRFLGPASGGLTPVATRNVFLNWQATNFSGKGFNKYVKAVAVPGDNFAFDINWFYVIP